MSATPPRIVARYPYRDARGTMLYEVVRYNPKGFAVRRASGTTLQPGARYAHVPYRLPELLADLLDREYVRVHRCRRRAYSTVADLGRIRACVE